MIWALVAFNVANLLFSAVAMFQRERHYKLAADSDRDERTDLLDRFQELIGTIHYHQVNAAKAAKAPPKVIPAEEAQYMSEEEQDLRYQAEHGYIDESALKEALKQIGFENSEIMFD